MATLTRTELGRDARGNKYQTNVTESFEDITPDASASSWTKVHADGIYTLTEIYTEAVPDPGGGGGDVYPDIWSLDITTGSEPIESNTTFKNFMSEAEMANWTAWKMGRETATDPKTSTNSVVQALYKRFNRGETDYLAPRSVLKLQRVYTAPPSLAGVGYASGTPDGCPFSFSSDLNWLFTGAHAVKEGNLYRVTKEWLSSANGKWDSYLYGGGS